MSFASFKSLLKNLSTSWWWPLALGVVSLVVPLILPLILPHTQMTKAFQSFMYPDSGWVGGVSFRLSDVPGYPGKSDLDLILLTQQSGDSSHITFLRNGSTPESVAAGAPAVSLVIDRAKTRTSGVPLFDVDLPSETLVAAGVEARRGAPQSRYTMITSQYTKDLSENGDLIVSTRNDVRSNRVFYFLCIFVLGLAAVFMPLFAQMPHPGDPDHLKSAAGAAGSD
jgi:hypothetical protein